MKVFIIWSKEPSKSIASEVKHLVEMCVPSASAWMSEVDIGKGQRWNGVISAELDTTDTGIVCCTPNNLTEPWIHFEAGALSKSLESGQVHPLCFGITKGELPQTLGQFQATEWKKNDVLELLQAIARECKPSPSARSVQGKFDRVWEGANKTVLSALKNAATAGSQASPPSLANRPPRYTHVRCPDCREFVFKDAKVCKCCGCKLDPQSPLSRTFGSNEDQSRGHKWLRS